MINNKNNDEALGIPSNQKERFSSLLPGVVDRKGPVPVAQPTPGGAYYPGGAIRVVFNEALNCQQPFRHTVLVQDVGVKSDGGTAEPLRIISKCQGDALSFAVKSETKSYAELVEAKVKVKITLTGVEDKYGPM